MFADHAGACLPAKGHVPRRPGHLEVSDIVLARGWGSSPERRRFVETVCALFPDATLSDRSNTPHNRIDVERADALARHQKGKHTLVFGELRDAIRFSEEEGNTCPNYWHFSPYGFCPYGCKYCYLAGTRGVWFSPTVKVFVNLPEILAAIDRHANSIRKPTAFYLGKLQDGLALDPLTGYSRMLVPFFAGHPFARQVILTKCAGVGQLLDLDHGGHTVLSWSLNPPEVARRFEEHTPAVEERLEAMRRCAERGYPVRAVLMPIIPVDGWQSLYSDFVRLLIERVPIQRLTLGGICIYRNALTLMEGKLGRSNAISDNLDRDNRLADGRRRYPADLRVRMYREIIAAAKGVVPNLQVALCLEDPDVWHALGLAERIGKCNCVL